MIVPVGAGSAPDVIARIVADALRDPLPGRFRVHFLSNVDGNAARRTLAGLDPATADKKAQLAALTRRLARAEYTIADDYLSGRVGREESIERLMKYTLASRERATQRLRFIDTYRSYIINYGLGRDVVQAWVERQGPDRWRGMETLLASQILPVDLL